MATCPICGTDGFSQTNGPNGAEQFNCRRCGIFLGYPRDWTLTIKYIQDGKIDRAALSHDIRKTTDAKPFRYFAIADEVPQRYLTAIAPSPQEQADNLILWIGNNQPSYASNVSARAEPIAAAVGAAVSPNQNNEPGLQWLFDQLAEHRLYDTRHDSSQGLLDFRLTMKGWAKYEELKRRAHNTRRAFMAMQFNDTNLDSMVQTHFKPAVARAGFELHDLTDQQPGGLIDNQIRAAIRSARFVIADLTHDNNGAYFEAGLAEGLGLPVIYTCEESKFQRTKTHFDTNHMTTILWNDKNPEDAARKLTATIRWTFPSDSKWDD